MIKMFEPKLTMFIVIPLILIVLIYYFFVSKVARAKKKLRKKTKEYEIKTSKYSKPSSDNKWLSMIDDDFYSKLKEMGNGNLAIIRWQKKRVSKMALQYLISIILAIVVYIKEGTSTISVVVIVASLGLPYFMYHSEKKRVNDIYGMYRFERQMQFAKFCRLLVPYLKQKKSGSLYGVFNKILPRLDYEKDKNLLMVLMKSMTDDPNSIQPFKNFASEMSGSDMADSFMMTVFDLTQGVQDTSIVEGLGRMATETMMNGIDQIIAYKSKKFWNDTSKILRCVLIIIIGYIVSSFVYNIKIML